MDRHALLFAGAEMPQGSNKAGAKEASNYGVGNRPPIAGTEIPKDIETTPDQKKQVMLCSKRNGRND